RRRAADRDHQGRRVRRACPAHGHRRRGERLPRPRRPVTARVAGTSWWRRLLGGGRPAADPAPAVPAPPTTEQIVTSVDAVVDRATGRAPAAVTARVQRVAETVHEMVPRLDRLGAGSQQAHTVVATATSYLPEAVDAYLRLPRDFADRRVVDRGKTSLMILCDQLDLLGATLD